MTVRKKRPPKRAPRPASPAPVNEDARGLVRIYADIEKEAAVRIGILALQRGTTRKALLEDLIAAATGNV